jgi:hypothetical protein
MNIIISNYVTEDIIWPKDIFLGYNHSSLQQIDHEVMDKLMLSLTNDNFVLQMDLISHFDYYWDTKNQLIFWNFLKNQHYLIKLWF